MNTILILTLGLLRALDGADKLPKTVANLCMAFAIVIWAGQIELIKSALIIGTYLLFITPGWGKYFMALHGEDKSHEKEIWVIDHFIDRIENKFLAGTVGMSLRWFVLALPLFGVLEHYGISSIEHSLVLLSIGPLYFAGGRIKAPFQLIEFISGCILGIAIWL
jgi:hypothetical protein